VDHHPGAALPSLLYQNSGYQQFGYRFLLDYLPYLIMLWRWAAGASARCSRSCWCYRRRVNLFGAITFDRYPQFSYEDNCIIPHGCN
jgi:hypothetical protein